MERLSRSEKIFANLALIGNTSEVATGTYKNSPHFFPMFRCEQQIGLGLARGRTEVALIQSTRRELPTRRRPQDNQAQLVWCRSHQNRELQTVRRVTEPPRGLDWTMSGNLVEFAAARGLLFIGLVLYSAVLE
jgi:hypothetical protein